MGTSAHIAKTNSTRQVLRFIVAGLFASDFLLILLLLAEQLAGVNG